MEGFGREGFRREGSARYTDRKELRRWGGAGLQLTVVTPIQGRDGVNSYALESTEEDCCV